VPETQESTSDSRIASANATDRPELVLAALEDGFRPSPNPDDWEGLVTVVTGRPCPVCETAVAVTLGPSDAVADYAASCRWHAAAEWADLLPVLEEWIQGDALEWRDRVRARREGGETA